MTTIVEVDHNSGSPVSAHWNNIVDTTPRLTITGASALGGSANGLNIATTTGDAFAAGDQAIVAPGSNEINLRIRVDFSPLTITGSQNLLAVVITGGITDVLTIEFRALVGVVQARATWQDDIPTLFFSSWVNITGETCLECSSIRNGVGVFKINSATQHTTVALTNPTQFNGMGFLGFTTNVVAAAGTSGAIYFDEILLNDIAASSLCGGFFGIITHGRQSALLFNQQAAPTLDGQFAFFVAEDTAGAQVRYIKMDKPTIGVVATPMAEAHTDATDTDGMVTTTASPDKMLFAGNDAVGGFVESHIVSTGLTTDLYSNAVDAINAMTAAPNLSSEALILEAGPVDDIRHTIDDFVTTQVTDDLSAFLAFVTSSLAAIFSRTPQEPSLRDMQAWLVGRDFLGGQAAFFIQLLTGSGIVVTDEAIAALQAATLITGVGIGR